MQVAARVNEVSQAFEEAHCLSPGALRLYRHCVMWTASTERTSRGCRETVGQVERLLLRRREGPVYAGVQANETRVIGTTNKATQTPIFDMVLLYRNQEVKR